MNSKPDQNDLNAELGKADDEIAAVSAEITSTQKDLTELVFTYISEDIFNWIKTGGCLECNGSGVVWPWGNRLTYQDTIKCPSCDGSGPKYSLSFANKTNPSHSYFPEMDYVLMDAARYVGLDSSCPIFWNPARTERRASLSAKLAKLKKKKQDLVNNKATLAAALAAKSATEKSAPVAAGSLPDLHGVSLRQINYGVVCRRAALENGKVTQEEASEITSAVHWIENYKNLVRR